ncbi:hypothetical protein G6F56_008440 [Rhizopus delemar]|nr:hypothetical protein G6F56_008440 [Rhizopus delemar]
MEYGWGHCLDDVVIDLDALDLTSAHNFYLQDPDSVMVNEWIPPSASMVSSTLAEREQFELLSKHLRELNNEINEHRDRKNKLIVKFPSKCHNYSQVITNWETRAHYLLHEIIKYQNYCDALEKSLEHKPLEPDNTEKLIYQTSQLDLFKEINQELHFNKSFL